MVPNFNQQKALLFDIETLISAAQPKTLLWIGQRPEQLLNDYQAQAAVLGHEVHITHLDERASQHALELRQRFDVAVFYNLPSNLDRSLTTQLISRLRDSLSAQFCVAIELDPKTWQLTDMLALGLRKVADYSGDSETPKAAQAALFKYSISDYKRTPDWLNADNWANPEMWGKYWW